MNKSAQVELVKTTTADGLRLDGVLQRTANDEALTLLVLHGAGSNFYSGSLFEQVTPPLVDGGYHVLRVNTRGHDGYYTARNTAGVVRQGAAYEVVDHCRLDIAGWLDWLETSGRRRVILMGHSLGAIKVIYSSAHQPDPRVAAVVAISPPRLSCRAFGVGPQSAVFTPTLRDAQRLVKEGQPDALLESKFPFPMLITASTFLDKYGDEKYNVEELVARVACPLALVFGSVELEQGGVAFAGLPEALRQRRPESDRSIFRVIPDADHFYVGRHAELAEALLAILGSIATTS